MKVRSFVFTIGLAIILGCRAGAQTSVVPGSDAGFIRAQDSLRKVGGQLYDINHSESWGDLASLEGLGQQSLDLHFHTIRKFMSVHKVLGATVFCDIYQSESYPEKYSGMLEEIGREYIKTVVILNCPKPESLTTGGGVHCWCMRTTNYHSSDGLSYRAYDCGTKPTQEEVKKWQDEKAERHRAIERELTEQRRAAAEEAAAAKKAMQDKVLKWHLELAEKGDAYGLFRMGEHYRDGDGAPKDLSKAREYFTKAVNAGSPTAADALSKLNQPSTNSPAGQ